MEFAFFQISIFITILLIGIVIVTILIMGGSNMAAIDNLKNAVLDLQALIGQLPVPVDEATIQAQADSINSSITAIKAREGIVDNPPTSTSEPVV